MPASGDKTHQCVGFRRGLDIGGDFAARHHARVTAIFDAELQAMPGIGEVLDSWLGARCVASSGTPARLRHALGLVWATSRPLTIALALLTLLAGLLPAGIAYFLMLLLPSLATILLAFTDYELGVLEWGWIGIANFEEMLEDRFYVQETGTTPLNF